MKSNDLTIVLSTLLAGLLLLAGASLISSPIYEQREALQLTTPKESIREMKPAYVLLSIVGGPVRNLGINIMWLRLNNFQRKQDLYQMQDVAKVITQLQPRHPRAWDFLAWNESYNISVTRHTAPERWQWVRGGLNRLQLQGIPINPQSTELYKQLAHYYNHKLWGTQDNMFQYYRQQTALDWHVTLGAPPDGDRDAFVEWLEAMVEFDPTTEKDDFIGPQIPVSQIIAKIREEEGAEIIDPQLQLMKEMGFNPSVTGYEEAKWIIRVVAFSEARQNPVSQLFPIKDNEKVYYETADKWLTDPAFNGSRERLIAGLRAVVVMGEKRMSPRKMQELTRLFGPLDWRHPLAHSIYWGHAGAVVSSMQVETEKLGFEAFNTRATISVVLQDLFQQGMVIYNLSAAAGLSDTREELYYRGYTPEVNYQIQPDFAPTMINAMDQLDETVYGNLGKEYLEHTRFRTWKENQLRFVVTVTYLYGDEKIAQRFYNELQTDFSKSTMFREAQYQMTMPEFVIGNIRSNLEFYDNALNYVGVMIERSIRYRYLLGKGEQAENMMKVAQSLHQWVDEYQKKIQSGSDRLQLPPFNFMVRNAYGILFKYRNLGPTTEAELWATIPLQLRQQMYDDLKPRFETTSEFMGWDVNKAFPEPPGMDAIRKRIEQRNKDRQEGGEGGRSNP